MPNKPPRDKQKYRPKSKPRHVAELMQRMLAQRVTQSGNPAQRVPADVSQEWRAVLQKALDPELAAHIANVLAKPRELVVFTESAAWCTRLKLAAGQLRAAAQARDASIAKVRVRIMPGGAAR